MLCKRFIARGILLCIGLYILRSPSSVADNYCIMFFFINCMISCCSLPFFSIVYYTFYYSNEYNLINNKMNLAFKLLGLIFVPTSFPHFISIFFLYFFCACIAITIVYSIRESLMRHNAAEINMKNFECN